MPDEDLHLRLRAALDEAGRSRLLPRGLARGLIWQDGNLPADAPAFAEALTDDLLDFGYGLLAMAIRLRNGPHDRLANDALLVAGESIEAAMVRGDRTRPDRMSHRLVAAISFHLAGYAARAFCMFPESIDAGLLSPGESALAHLLRRAFFSLRVTISEWLLSEEHTDASWASRLQGETDFDENDAISEALTRALLRAIATFDHGLSSGSDAEAQQAKELLLQVAVAASDLRAVPHWWNATLAYHLIDGLWTTSLHKNLPLAPDGDTTSWNPLRRNYIDRLRMRPRAAVEFWPSQISAAARAIDRDDSLVVALPTSAGKTRIAEMCILRALADEKRVVYVTPLRALSAQVEHDLAETFVPLGFRVSALYGSAGSESGDARTLREGVIVVATPEKLDFALRNDATLLDDVALVVLDEGHMLGPDEREVRYEALVQRLLRRADAETRRVVCLSAVFPRAEEMTDLVKWIRRDRDGPPVHSEWRPTRQRFATLVWDHSREAARLEIGVEDQRPYVNQFVVTSAPPEGSRRRSPFPHEKNELVLAAAWKFALEQHKDVLVYCALKRSVETLGELALKCLAYGLLPSLRQPTQDVLDAINIGVEWLGTDHPAVECLRHGIALHHGSLPRQFLSAVEQLLRSRRCPVVIASPTLAQGLNLSASILLVPSLWRNREIIPSREFSNVVGRAGRAFVDLEGLIIHVVWEPSVRKRNARLKEWNALIRRIRAAPIQSGLLVLAQTLLRVVSFATGLSEDQAIESLAGTTGWDLSSNSNDQELLRAWDTGVASLDAAILGLVDADVAPEQVGAALDEVLRGSLFARQIERLEAAIQTIARQVLAQRAAIIWGDTSAEQRRGYHLAGVGLRAGRFLDQHQEELLGFLVEMEFALGTGDHDPFVDAAVRFATIAFQMHPFRPDELPTGWEEALAAWLLGHPATSVIGLVDDGGADLVQDAFGYRLPWATEAVRVHASATNAVAAALDGTAGLAIETGSLNRAVIMLIRSGMRSRELAKALAEATNATFVDFFGMLEWVDSPEASALTANADWPFVGAGAVWHAFRDGLASSESRKWSRDRQLVAVHWLSEHPDVGTPVLVDDTSRVFSIVYDLLGELDGELDQPRSSMTRASVTADGQLEVDYFGVHVINWSYDDTDDD